VTALVLLAVGAGLLLVGYGRTWVTATSAEAGFPRLSVDFTGRDLQPVGGVLPVVALAGVAGLVATRRLGRRVSGVVLVLTGVTGLVLPIMFGVAGTGRDEDDVARLLAERLGVGAQHVEHTSTLWWVPAAAGGALVLLGGVLATLRGGRWPQMGHRYERDDSTSATATASSPQRTESAWDQLDRGLDPTSDDPAADSAGDPAGDPAGE
jgi:uncharacterized membrane protein (TIGR02234 family)